MSEARGCATDGDFDEDGPLFYEAEGARGSQRQLTFVVEKQRYDSTHAAHLAPCVKCGQ